MSNQVVKEVKMHGLKELDKALDELIVPRFRRKALVDAGKEAMQPVLESAKRYAPSLSPLSAEKNPNITAGALKNDIRMTTTYNKDVVARNGKIRSRQLSEMKVTVKTGAETEDYALITEYGREEFFVERKTVFGKEVDPFIAPVAAIDPQPYMRPALDENVDRVLSRFFYSLGEAIIKQAKRQARHFKKGGK